MSQLVTAVLSRENDGARTYHLAKGPGTSEWQDIHCGGGIVFPGPRAHVVADDICAACVTAKASRSASPALNLAGATVHIGPPDANPATSDGFVELGTVAPASSPTYGMCTACGSVEVALDRVTGHHDLSDIGESDQYPTGYGCEVCS